MFTRKLKIPLNIILLSTLSSLALANFQVPKKAKDLLGLEQKHVGPNCFGLALYLAGFKSMYTEGTANEVAFFTSSKACHPVRRSKLQPNDLIVVQKDDVILHAFTSLDSIWGITKNGTETDSVPQVEEINKTLDIYFGVLGECSECINKEYDPGCRYCLTPAKINFYRCDAKNLFRSRRKMPQEFEKEFIKLEQIGRFTSNQLLGKESQNSKLIYHASAILHDSAKFYERKKNKLKLQSLNIDLTKDEHFYVFLLGIQIEQLKNSLLTLWRLSDLAINSADLNETTNILYDRESFDLSDFFVKEHFKNQTKKAAKDP